jgi:carbamoylphosphate synthase small subunit
MNKKVYVVGNQTGYANWLLEMGMKLVVDPYIADIAMFTGGADVDASWYGEKNGSRNYPDYQRDVFEIKYYKLFLELGIPMIGICRGGQLFTIMNGGKLVQHSSHPYAHIIKTKDGEVYEINSMHHQQFLLTMPEEDYELIAWSDNISRMHLGENDIDYCFNEDYKEPEVVFFPKTQCLAIQCHPECIENNRTMEWFKELVNVYLLKEENVEA